MTNNLGLGSGGRNPFASEPPEVGRGHQERGSGGGCQGCAPYLGVQVLSPRSYRPFSHDHEGMTPPREQPRSDATVNTQLAGAHPRKGTGAPTKKMKLQTANPA